MQLAPASDVLALRWPADVQDVRRNGKGGKIFRKEMSAVREMCGGK